MNVEAAGSRGQSGRRNVHVTPYASGHLPTLACHERVPRLRTTHKPRCVEQKRLPGSDAVLVPTLTFESSVLGTKSVIRVGWRGTFRKVDVHLVFWVWG